MSETKTKCEHMSTINGNCKLDYACTNPLGCPEYRKVVMSEIERAIDWLNQGILMQIMQMWTDQSKYNAQLAIQALEKQIPYTPTKCNVTLGRCKCGVGFISKTTNYCGNCGQALEWGEDCE